MFKTSILGGHVSIFRASGEAALGSIAVSKAKLRHLAISIWCRDQKSCMLQIFTRLHCEREVSIAGVTLAVL